MQYRGIKQAIVILICLVALVLTIMAVSQPAAADECPYAEGAQLGDELCNKLEEQQSAEAPAVQKLEIDQAETSLTPEDCDER